MWTSKLISNLSGWESTYKTLYLPYSKHSKWMICGKCVQFSFLKSHLVHLGKQAKNQLVTNKQTLVVQMWCIDSTVNISYITPRKEQNYFTVVIANVNIYTESQPSQCFLKPDKTSCLNIYTHDTTAAWAMSEGIGIGIPLQSRFSWQGGCWRTSLHWGNESTEAPACQHRLL